MTKLGYGVAVKDPYCITLTRGGSIIDLYVHPSLGGVAFINGQRLLEHARIVDFEGVEIGLLRATPKRWRWHLTPYTRSGSIR